MTAFLGIDYGKRRIGVAAGDDARGIAFALTTHVEGRDGSILSLLSEMVAERQADAIVVGLPLQSDGAEGEMAAAARKFADLLSRKLDIEVILWDERYSSAEADRWLKDKKNPQKSDRDALAAEIILQSYLDHLSRDSGP